MAASAAGRTACLRMMCRMSVNSGARGVSVSPMSSSIPATFLPRRVLFSSSPFRLLRRELSSLRPLHCAIASACLVSKLPLEASSSTEEKLRAEIREFKSPLKEL